MNKRVLHILTLLMILVPVSCTDIINGVRHEGDCNVVFTLVNSELSTRADEAGVEGYNENLITKADIFLYADQNANAICKLSWTGSEQTQVSINATLTEDQLDALFGDGATAGTCYGYAVVNGPDTPDVATDTDTKIATLKALQIGGTGTFNLFPSASFVMDGESRQITLQNDQVTGNIDLYRAASKIQLYLPQSKLTQYTDGEGNIWYPQTEGMAVSFYNGVHTSRVDVEGANNLTTGNYFHLSETTTGEERYKLTLDGDNYTHMPFYSYSSDWGRETSPDNEAYLSLRIYWKKGENGTAEPYYYRVPINLEGKKLDRNTWYKINLEVGVLGDKSENSKVELTPEYIIVDWSTLELSATLAEYHYLVVEKEYVEMFNTETVTIGYQACSDVTVNIMRMIRPDFSDVKIDTTYYHGSDYTPTSLGYGTATKTVTTSAGLLNACTLTHDEDANTFTINHALVNSMSEDEFDYAIYTIVVRVATTDGCGLYQDIVINQYPSKYIEGDVTTYNASDNKYGYDLSKYGTVWVNGNGGPGKTYSSTSWNRVENTLSSGENNNPNSYVLTITAFEESESYNSTNNTGYIIADPRDRSKYYSAKGNTPTIENGGLEYSSASAPAKDGTTRQLTYYYTTLASLEDANDLDDSDYRMRLIAPKLRFATAYGRKGQEANVSTREGAVKRCSSYQEYGRPAGRWRVPTPAELDYISQMCQKGIIPWIFKNQTGGNGKGGSGYTSSFGAWSTDGTVSISNSITSVRCVYDEWYWGNDNCDPEVFTWGDAQMK